MSHSFIFSGLYPVTPLLTSYQTVNTMLNLLQHLLVLLLVQLLSLLLLPLLSLLLPLLLPCFLTFSDSYTDISRVSRLDIPGRIAPSGPM